MKKAYFILFLIFVLETVHTLFSGTPFGSMQFDPFPLFDFKDESLNVTTELYVWFIMRQSIVLLYGLALTYLPKKRRIVIYSYMVLDIVVFLLHYSSAWGLVFGFPIGLYLIKSISLACIIIYEKRASLYRAFNLLRSRSFTGMALQNDCESTEASSKKNER